MRISKQNLIAPGLLCSPAIVSQSEHLCTSEAPRTEAPGLSVDVYYHDSKCTALECLSIAGWCLLPEVSRQFNGGLLRHLCLLLM